MQVRPHFYWGRPRGEKWKECVLCHPLTKWVELHYYSGSVAPTVGETLTGATTSDTLVVASTTIFSGSVAGGDAAGIIQGTIYTGLDTETEDIFQADEPLNGSTGGSNMATVKWPGCFKNSGIIHPKSYLIKRDGRWYCKEHYPFKFHLEDLDDQEVNISENYRYKE